NLGPQSFREIKQRLAGLGRHLAEQGAPDAAAAAAGPNGAEARPQPAAAASGANGAPAAVPAPNGAGAPGATQPGGRGATEPSGPGAPRAARPPDEDAIDLLSVAGFPVLKRALPVIGAVVLLLLVIAGLRGRRRRD